MLSHRQISIVKLLQLSGEYTTMGKIADHLGVSIKTVRNDIGAIKEYCAGQQSGTIIAKPHEGVKIIFEEGEWELFEQKLEEADEKKFLQTDIKYTVIELLLKKKTVSFLALEKRLYMGRGTIEKALPLISSWFQNHNILCEKKRGRGMEIFYTEFHWRMAMWRFFCDSKPDVKQKETMLLELLDGFDCAGVEKGVRFLEQSFGLIFGYEGHLQMIFLLSLSVLRLRQKKYVSMPNVEAVKVDGTFDLELRKRLSADLEDYYQIQIPDAEKEYLLFVIRISDIQGFASITVKDKFQMDHLELCYVTMKIINLMGDIINIDLKSDQFFTDSLFMQLRSTIQRLKYHISWPHPLLKQVKQKYPNIFAAIYAAGVFFNKELGLEINENEMCSLALHLGGALERNITILTACVICNYGIGVSQLLKERIERNIPDLRILEVFSARDARKIRNIQCDFLISTLPMEELSTSKEIIVVEHLLPAGDIKKIGEKMKQLRKFKLRTKNHHKEVQLHRNLFNPEFIWIQEEAEDKARIIHKMCKALADAGYVTEQYEQSVFEHEEMAPTELGSRVAIPHGYAKHVIHPVVACAALKQPVEWQEHKRVDLIFMLAFNLDEASGLKEETIKFYSVFLDLLDSEEELQRVRNIVDKKELAEYMNQKVR